MVKAIELATAFEIQVVERPVYIINGAKRAYLSERAALNKLSSILTEREFRKAGLKTNHPDTVTYHEDGTPVNNRGEPLPEFMARKAEIFDRLHEALNKEREIKRLEMEYEKAKDKCKDADIVANEVYKKLMAAQNL